MGGTRGGALAVAAALALVGAARAQETATEGPAPVTTAAEAAGPVTIHVGLMLLRIDALDLTSEQATVTFYLWTRWRADNDVDGAAFEVMNGTLESKDSEYLREEGGYKYAYYRCRATVNLEVDFRAFPFDEHRLVILLEHAEADVARAVCAIDHESMKHLRPPTRSGWIIGEPRFEVQTVSYRTNWGMIGVSPDDVSSGSRVRASVTLQHAAMATFTKTFLTLIISMMITFLAFLMHPEELEARVGVGVAGIFGAVSSHSTVSDSLPEISYMTLADRVHALSHFFIFTTLLTSAYVSYLEKKGRADDAVRANRRAWIATSVAYAAGMVWMIWRA